MEKVEIEPAKQEYRDLLEVAQKVSAWITDEERMKYFQEQAKAFYDDFVKWEEQEQTPYPLDWLVLPYATCLDAHIGLLISDDKPKQLSIPFDKEKSLRADYVLLTIIHDKRLKNPRTPLISHGIWSEDEEWGVLKWEEISEGYACGSRNIQAHFNSAIKRIEKDGQDENWHNDDFTEVLWNGKKYKFNKSQQALSVKYLWNNKRAREKSIGEAIGSEADNFRLIHIFRQRNKKSKMHPAWGIMIVPDGKGIFALAECKKAPKQ